MVGRQNGLCAICRGPETATRGGKVKTLSVDHDHESGRIRALLCTKCNVALGLLNDDPDLFLRAADYLRRYQ